MKFDKRQHAGMVSAREAERLFAVSRFTIFRWAERGHLALHRIGNRRVLFYLTDIKTILAARMPDKLTTQR